MGLFALVLCTQSISHAQTSADFSDGSMILGYDSTVCSAAIEGSIRYNGSGGTLANDLVGHWKLDETSGTTINAEVGSNGTFSGAASVSSSSGKIGTSINFDGTNDGISVPNSASLENFTAFTLAAWVYQTQASQAAASRIISKSDTVSGDNYALRLTNDNVGASFRMEVDGDNQTDLNSNTDIQENEWTHIVGTWDGSNMRLYINGSEDSASPVAKSGTIDADGKALMIGTHEDAPALRRFEGLIDDVRVYDAALSAAEVRDLYEYSGPAIEFCGEKTGVAGCSSIGDLCTDGSYYAGLSPDGNVPMYVTSSAHQHSNIAYYDGVGQSDAGASSTTDGDGNTLFLMTDGHTQHKGPKHCYDMTAHGHNDWYMPAVNELSNLYNGGSPIAGVSSWYWSSTENNASHAKVRNVSTNATQNWSKGIFTRVRCVRQESNSGYEWQGF